MLCVLSDFLHSLTECFLLFGSVGSHNGVNLSISIISVYAMTYQMSEVWMHEDVAIIGDSKCITMNTQLEEAKLKKEIIS